MNSFAARYPRVWHVMETEASDCDTLYPAETLRRLAGMSDEISNRDDFVLVRLPSGGTAVLRQQLMPDGKLTPTLAGRFAGRPDLWRAHIDRHVFFWVTADRCDRFRDACIRLRARGGLRTKSPPLVLGIDTATLLARHTREAYFARINSGSTVRGGARVRRDEATLSCLDRWRGEPVVELAIRAPVALAGLI